MLKIEALTRHCISAADDLVAMDLGNIEEHWSYMVRLKSLSSYLEVKVQIYELDEEYTYAQLALIHYIDWMMVNECPYLDKP